MSYRVRFTEEVEDDLLGLFDFMLERSGIAAASDALAAIRHALELLAFSPFSCRKAGQGDPFLRELVMGHGASGHVALFEIENGDTVTLLAVRQQREEDYH